MKNLKEKKYIFFDLDGTLTDSYPAITTSFLYATSGYERSFSERELASIIGPPLKDSFMRLLGVDNFEAWELVTKYREYYNNGGLYNCKIYDGIEETLEALSNADKILVVCTSKPEEQAKRVLEHFNLARYFTFIGGDDEGCSRSPKEMVIAYCLDALNNPNLDDVVMVGDRSYDVTGALEVGVTPVGVTYGYGSKRELETSGATYIVDSAEQLKELLI